MNLGGISHSFSLSFALFTFLDQQETRQENSRVSLSKTQLISFRCGLQMMPWQGIPAESPFLVGSLTASGT